MPQFLLQTLKIEITCHWEPQNSCNHTVKEQALPYARREDNALAVAGQLLLVVLFIGCILIKVFEDVSAADAQVASNVLGFESTGTIVALLIFFTFSMLLVLMISLGVAIHDDALVPTLRVQATGAVPELTLRPSEVYHLFLSHIWGTGQVRCPSVL